MFWKLTTPARRMQSVVGVVTTPKEPWLHPVKTSKSLSNRATESRTGEPGANYGQEASKLASVADCSVEMIPWLAGQWSQE
jgi:hypothetical protein